MAKITMEVSKDGQSLLIKIPLVVATRSVLARMNPSGTQVLPYLTKREKEVFALALQGKVAKDMASELNLSIRTIKFHLSVIYKKMGVPNMRELLVACKDITEWTYSPRKNLLKEAV